MTPKLQRICMRLKTIVEDADKKVHSIHALYYRFNTAKLIKSLSSFKEKGFSVTARWHPFLTANPHLQLTNKKKVNRSSTGQTANMPVTFDVIKLIIEGH